MNTKLLRSLHVYFPPRSGRRWNCLNSNKLLDGVVEEPCLEERRRANQFAAGGRKQHTFSRLTVAAKKKKGVLQLPCPNQLAGAACRVSCVHSVHRKHPVEPLPLPRPLPRSHGEHGVFQSKSGPMLDIIAVLRFTDDDGSLWLNFPLRQASHLFLFS